MKDTHFFKPTRLMGALNINPIPLEFSNSLTTTEILAGMQKVINDIIKRLGEYEKYVDSKLIGIEETIHDNIINEIKDELQALSDEVRQQLEENKATLDANDADNKRLIEEFKNYTLDLISELRIELKNYHDVSYNSLKAYVDEKDAELRQLLRGGEILVTSVVNGNEVTLDVALNEIYDSVRSSAITAGEFDAKELTASAFDALEITAKLFDMQAKDFIN